MSMFELIFVVFISPFVFFLGFLFLFVLSPLTEPIVVWCERMFDQLDKKLNRNSES